MKRDFTIDGLEEVKYFLKTEWAEGENGPERLEHIRSLIQMVDAALLMLKFNMQLADIIRADVGDARYKSYEQKWMQNTEEGNYDIKRDREAN